MKLNCHIISTQSQRLATISVETLSAGMDRTTIRAAEQAAKTWAAQNGRTIVSDIFSQGEYRAWVS